MEKVPNAYVEVFRYYKLPFDCTACRVILPAPYPDGAKRRLSHVHVRFAATDEKRIFSEVSLLLQL